MKVSEIASRIERRIPKVWAEEWDNPGLAVGELDADVARIAVALDATPETVERAASLGCAMLVTHHPIIFHPAKSVVDNSIVGRTIIAAVRKGVSLYAAHTNWDSSPEGVNVVLGSLLGLADIAPLLPSRSGGWGLGVIGNLPEAVTMAELSGMVAEKWKLKNFTLYGDSAKRVMRVAAGGGACADFWQTAMTLGAECFVTADVPYHLRAEALAAGMSVIDADHAETERPSLPALAKVVAEETELPATIIPEVDAPFIYGTDIVKD